MPTDTSKSEQQKQVLALEPHSVQAELERTRVLLREVLEALLDDGWSFNRDSAISEWFNEEVRRVRIEA